MVLDFLCISDPLDEDNKVVIIHTLRFHYSGVQELEKSLRDGLGPEMLTR